MKRQPIKIPLEYWPGKPNKVGKINISYKRRIDGQLVSTIHEFIRHNMKWPARFGFENVVIGLSGGMDSTVTALLCHQALGKNKVTAVTVDLGFKEHAEQTKFAMGMARKLGINHKVIYAQKLFDYYYSLMKERGPFTDIDLITRIIHNIVFQVADSKKAVVISTLDKSEDILARHMEYFYGHFAPIADLYKTEVFDLSHFLGIPEDVIKREPGCVEGQFDKVIFGAPYEVLDPILYLITERKWPPERIAQRYRIDPVWLGKIEYRIRSHKWRMHTKNLLLS